MEGESELMMVSRHVSEGEIIVARQRSLVQRIRDAGGDADMSEVFLAQFESVQALHLAHLARLLGRQI